MLHDIVVVLSHHTSQTSPDLCKKVHGGDWQSWHRDKELGIAGISELRGERAAASRSGDFGEVDP